MLDVFLDALIDSAKILPILLVVYFLIEFIEFEYAGKIGKSKFLNGKLSPIYGSLFGSIPQCGFSIVAADLYSKQKLSIGALIAIFIATSDEAIPIMLSQPGKIPMLLLLIGVKIVLGIGAGYLAMLIIPKIFKKQEEVLSTSEAECKHGCCHHDLEQRRKYDWKHPLIHSAKIFTFIFVVNFILGTIIHFVGEDKFTNFLASSYVFQPLFACLIGLIPNCAASVVITELYMLGGISFGSIIAGLSVNAGIGFLVLFKQNKNIKENLFIMGFVVAFSLIFGYVLHFIV